MPVRWSVLLVVLIAGLPGVRGEVPASSYGTDDLQDWQTYMTTGTVEVPHRAAEAVHPSACGRMRRAAYGFTITQLANDAFALEVIEAARRTAAKTTADVLVLVNPQQTNASVLALLRAGLRPLTPQVQIRLVAPPLVEANLPASVVAANRENANCCGWVEFMKLAWWSMGNEYDRIISLDVDIWLRHSIDHLFSSGGSGACRLRGDNNASVLFTVGCVCRAGSCVRRGALAAEPTGVA